MTSPIKYCGASFYRCALQVNPYAYADRHGKDSGAANEAEYNQKMLQACRDAKIDIVGLADHGGAGASESLRQVLRDGGVCVFPGFEISSAEKIHMVCLFPEDKSKADLDQCLGGLTDGHAHEIGEDPTIPSTRPCLDIANLINVYGGFWFAPHMDGASGLITKGSPHVWKDNLVRVGALTKDVDDLGAPVKDVNGFGDGDGDRFEKTCRKIVENSDPNYKRDRPIALICANDAHSAESLKKERASCWIKMTEPKFDSFKQAFFDPESRIALQKPDDKRVSRIVSIRWSGQGFFRESEIEFSPCLNAVIGGRGAGKSSLLESIRYGLNCPPIADDAKKTFDQMVDNNLADSKVEILVWSGNHGQHYKVSRRHTEKEPRVVTESGESSNLSVQDILPGIDILGQNEILEISKDEREIRKLLDRFLPDSSSISEEIRKIAKDLKENRVKLLQLDRCLEDLEQKTNQGKALEEQIEILRKRGIEEKIDAFGQIVAERRFIEQMERAQELIVKRIDDWGNNVDIPNLPDEAEKWPNITDIRASHNSLTNAVSNVEQMRESAREKMNAAGKDLHARKESLVGKWEKLQDELDNIVEGIPRQDESATNIASDYKQLLLKKSQVLLDKQEEQKKRVERDGVVKQRDNLLAQYHQRHFDRFNERETTARELRKRLRGRVRVRIESMRERNDLLAFLESKVKGVGKARLEGLKNAPKIDTLAMAKEIRDPASKGLASLLGESTLAPGVANSIARMSEEDSYELEEIAIEDRVVIELNLAETDRKPEYRLLQDLSTGQKCTAILALFLLDRESPLILDQPEDHLDNSFIADDIVPKIRKIKGDCQIILSTHNANIPVFGDAELIAVLEPDGSRHALIKEENLGAIDKQSVKNEVARILDGGREAFNMRREKYGY